MRKLLIAIAAMTAGLSVASTADAAARWTCDGAEYICGPAPSVTKAPAYDASDDKPARRTKTAKAKKQDTASVGEDDDKPARRRKARSYDNDSGGGADYAGKASYYWQPQALASGGRFNPNAFTAAHKTLPFGTRVRVTNHNNGQSVDVVINDRGPYVAGRIIDLSKAAAHSINMQNSGVVPVSVRVLGRG
jgi:rare lipoprotein A